MIKTGFYRFSLGGCVLLSLSLSAPMALAGGAGSAYFSIEGDINTAGDQYDFFFDTSRAINSFEVVRFETFTHAGGINAAGDTIASSNFDSELNLFDGLGGQIAQDDESGPDFDALITWAVNQPFGTSLPAPLPSDSYRLNLRKYANLGNNTGPFAVDLVGPTDAMTVTGASPVGTGTLNSLKFGTANPAGPSATFNQSTTLTISDNLTIAKTGKAVFNNSGTTTVHGTTDLNTAGTLTQTAGILYTDTVNLNGGTLDIQGGVWSVNTLTGLTTLDIDGYMSIGDINAGPSAASLTVGSGQSLDVLNTFSVGEVGKAGTLTINNGGVVTAQNTARIGGFGGTNGSSINIGDDGLFNVGTNLFVGGFSGGPGGTSTLTIGGTSNTAKAEVDGSVTIYNGSTVNVNDHGLLEVDGSVNVQGGSTLNLNGGTLTADTIDHTNFGIFNFTGGTLHVDTFDGFLFHYGGTLAPGNSPGITTITHDYFNAGGTIEIEMDGLTAGADFDQIQIADNAQLDSTSSVLDIVFPNAFTYMPGDSMLILQASVITGTFSSVNFATNPGAQFGLIYTPTTVTLLAGLPGDLNNDGFVGIADLDIVLGNWNQNVTAGVWAGGDPTGDGFIGIADLDVVLGNWNAGTPPGETSNIPEPSSLLLLLGLSGLALVRGDTRQGACV